MYKLHIYKITSKHCTDNKVIKQIKSYTYHIVGDLKIKIIIKYKHKTHTHTHILISS